MLSHHTHYFQQQNLKTVNSPCRRRATSKQNGPTTTQQHRRLTTLKVAILLLASAAAMPASAAAGACQSEKFPADRNYATCLDLPNLGATLHWTYDEAAASLSLAFAAKPTATDGWVAWGINPTRRGMRGMQALLAFKQNGAYLVNTYNISCDFLNGTSPILFNPTEFAADEGADGKVRIYGKLQLPKGIETVNHLWNVGPTVISGVPAVHGLAPENKQARGSLALAGAPAPAPALSGGMPSPSAATTSYMLAPVLVVLLGLAGFLAIV